MSRQKRGQLEANEETTTREAWAGYWGLGTGDRTGQMTHRCSPGLRPAVGGWGGIETGC